jgi:2-succinyl-5-enolpyruvyl-6-hydroxy-3-cyclohexene-1-carboxylate synthase
VTSTANVQATFARTVVDEWVRCGLTHAVIAPGSRSTPLAVALVDDGRVRVEVVLDERSAGYRALGIGLATGSPAVVLTTSGTAAVELHPAVVEAHQARVPLLAVTADRPPELHHVGAPQTVEQAGLFTGAVRWSLDAGVPDDQAKSSWRSIAARCVIEAAGHPSGPGPVHLNVAFREPLLGEVEGMPAGRKGGGPWHRPEVAPAFPPAELVSRLAAMGAPGLIVAGRGAGEVDAVLQAAAALGWPVLADALSSCRVPSPHTVAAADALLRCDAVRAGGDYRPEVVLRLGAPWASRVVNEWLAGLDAEQILVDPHGSWADPDRRAALVSRCDPTILCLAVAETDVHAAPEAWRQRWQRAEASAQAAMDRVLDGHREITEPGVARTVAAVAPNPAVMVASSSMPIRDLEWFGAPRDGLRVVSNRGANGIDGVTSTALGVATALRGVGPTIALLGDLAFLHDAGGVLGAPGLGVDCTLVVVDNDGGGIFSFLPQAGALSAPQFERLFGTPHGIDLSQLAEAHGIPVDRPGSAEDVGPIVAESVAAGGVRMVHVRTDRAANVAIHVELQEAVAAAIS